MSKRKVEKVQVESVGSTFLSNVVEGLGDDFVNLASSGLISAEHAGWLDTGCYALNALCSGTIFGGVPDNKVTCFQGDAGCGKTFMVLGLIKDFQTKYEDGVVVYFDSEAAVTRKMMEDRGLDTTRILIVEPISVQDFRTKAIKILKSYEDQAEGKRPPMVFVLDSLGQLSSTKELADTEAGEDKRDMTKAAEIKATFRVLTLRLARLKVPFLMTNHTYNTMSQYTPKKGSGGTGPEYAASTIINLSKSKHKEGADVVGVIITAKNPKSRMSKENQEAELMLRYSSGLDKYYGLRELACKYGIFKKVSTKIELPDGNRVYGKDIDENPEQFYTREVLELIDKAAHLEYSYGSYADEDESYPEEENAE
jgi:RecA/RadA recombinase